MPEHTPPQPPPLVAPGPDDRSEDRARSTRGLRRNLAALSLVGAALVALPVVQLLRYQSAELDALEAGRARLDPVARAVQVQRGLLAHRDITARVLGGLPQLEAERRVRQNDVEGSLSGLAVTLAAGRWELALGEADDLHQDWLQLVQQVAARRIDAPGSDQAHRLLVEQTLQVIDLVGSALQAADHSDSALRQGPAPSSTLAVVHAMPRLIWQTRLLALGDAAPAAGTAADRAAALQARLSTLEAGWARTLGRLESLHSPRGARPATDEALLQAGATAGAATERYFSLLRGPSPSSAPARAAGLAAVQAQTLLFDRAHGTAAAALAAQTRSAVQQRTLLLGALTLLSLLALALTARLWRGLPGLQRAVLSLGADGPAPRAGNDQTERQTQTEHLLARLRQAAATAPPVPSAESAAADTAKPATD